MKKFYVLFTFILFISINKINAQVDESKTVTVYGKQSYGKNGYNISASVKVYYKSYVLNETFVDVIVQNIQRTSNYFTYNGKQYSDNNFPDIDLPKLDKITISWDVYSSSNMRICTDRKSYIMTGFDKQSNVQTRNFNEVFPGINVEKTKTILKKGFYITNIKITNVSWSNLGWYEIENAIKKKEHKKQNDTKYANAITNANNKFRNKKYEEARDYYKEALQYKQNDSYAQDKIKNINDYLDQESDNSSNTRATTTNETKSTTQQTQSDLKKQQQKQLEENFQETATNLAYALSSTPEFGYINGSYMSFGLIIGSPKGKWAEPLDISRTGLYYSEEYFKDGENGLGATRAFGFAFSFNVLFNSLNKKKSSLFTKFGGSFINTKLNWDTLLVTSQYKEDNYTFNHLNYYHNTMDAYIGLGYYFLPTDWVGFEIYSTVGLHLSDISNFSYHYQDEITSYTHNMYTGQTTTTTQVVADSDTEYSFKNKPAMSFAVGGTIRFPYVKIEIEYWQSKNDFDINHLYKNYLNDTSREKTINGKKTIKYLKLSLFFVFNIG